MGPIRLGIFSSCSPHTPLPRPSKHTLPGGPGGRGWLLNVSTQLKWKGGDIQSLSLGTWYTVASFFWVATGFYVEVDFPLVILCELASFAEKRTTNQIKLPFVLIFRLRQHIFWSCRLIIQKCRFSCSYAALSFRFCWINHSWRKNHHKSANSAICTIFRLRGHIFRNGRLILHQPIFLCTQLHLSKKQKFLCEFSNSREHSIQEINKAFGGLISIVFFPV